jgi:2-(3-amino-3-carboxypropyl)histidine synthase
MSEPSNLVPKSRLRGARQSTEQHEDATSTTTAATSSTRSIVRSKLRGRTSSRRSGKPKAARMRQTVPDEIRNDPALAVAMQHLPSNYNFEIPKSIWRLRESKSKCVALQFPEGLLMYACIISDILQQFAGVDTLIMGDVTYGACCVDDFTARALGADFFIHYGHSCLVPIDVSEINMLYVFVDIRIDVQHFVESMKHNFAPETRMVIAGTIQFASSMHTAHKMLKTYFTDVYVPQARPLSKGEVLGCTSPSFGDYDTLVFLADGRFHLESIMIQNPHIPSFYKYDPYNKKLTTEQYDHKQMHEIRRKAIATASEAKRFGLILGTLGRQGNPDVLQRMEELLNSKNIPFVTVLLSEIFPSKLSQFADVEAWVQVACPRLSIDWGYAFEVPLLSSYEAEVALGSTAWQQVYPMDYYRQDGGSWANYHKRELARKERIANRKVRRKKVTVEVENES